MNKQKIKEFKMNKIKDNDKSEDKGRGLIIMCTVDFIRKKYFVQTATTSQLAMAIPIQKLKGTAGNHQLQQTN